MTSLQYQLLQPHQAPLLAEGLQRVYGRTYPIPEFYDPGYVTDMLRAGKLHTVVAMNQQGEVVAQMSTVLEQPGDVTADGSALMVDRDYRGQGATHQLGWRMTEVYRELGIAGLHLYALALHERVQNKSIAAGAAVTGVLPAWFSRSARVDGYDYPEGARIGAVCLYMPLSKLPARRNFLPAQYQEVLAGIYTQLGAERSLLPAPGRASSTTTSLIGRDARVGNGHLRLLVDTVGKDFSERLADESSNPESEFEVCYLDLSLLDPGLDEGVSQAREQGFFFGGLMVDRCGADRLRLQRYAPELVCPEAMVISSAEGLGLRDFVLEDSAGVSPRSLQG